jgi:hypothetical protein
MDELLIYGLREKRGNLTLSKWATVASLRLLSLNVYQTETIVTAVMITETVTAVTETRITAVMRTE